MVSEAQIGRILRARVTATGPGGTRSASSAASQQVSAAPGESEAVTEDAPAAQPHDDLEAAPETAAP